VARCLGGHFLRVSQAVSCSTTACHMIRIIGGGLAGCEAAWQAASRGVPVTL
jgi:NADPH-dependent 2,4-dienoyl-CoA reductase/sulfur reductase-like enzyme